MASGKNLLRLFFSIMCFSFIKLKISENEDQYNLVVLNESNAANYVSMNKELFILVHSPWCKWSQKFHSNLVKINKFLKYEAQSIYLASIDVTLVNINIFKDFLPASVEPHTITYPKLIYLQNGMVNELYNGIMDVDNTYLWIKRKIQPISLKVNLMQVFQTKIKFDKVSFMFFGDYSSANNNFQIFNKISSEMQTSTFYHSDEKLFYDYLNPQRNYTVGFFKYGILNDTLSGDITVEKLKEFINLKVVKNYYDRVNEEAIQDIFIRKNPAVIFFISKYDDEYIFYYRTFKKIASDYRAKVFFHLIKDPNLKFLMTDIDKKLSLKVANFFGFRSDENLPTIRIVDYENNNQYKKYSLSRNITRKSIVNFIEKWKAKELRSYINFDSYETEIKKLSKDSIVKKIDYNTIYESVNFNKKSVVVLFYTEWCSVCKKVLFVYETFSKRFNRELITFLMINLQNHENNSHLIRAVPALYLYPFNNKENPSIYEGQYNIRAMTEFITSNLRIQVIKQDL